MKTEHLLKLLELLARKEGQSLDHYGFGKMSDALCKFYVEETGLSLDNEIITQRYLYDLYRKSVKKMKKGELNSSPRIVFVDTISKYLDYPSYQHFEASQTKNISKELESCIGNWWSYVRANSGEYIFKAPVRIAQDSGNSITIELRSSERVFSGIIEEVGGCLTSTLISDQKKALSIILKLGNSTHIKLLKGVFSGISSGGDPIAGREVFLREENLPFKKMVWEKLAINSEEIDSRISGYFQSYEKNCIKVSGVSSFDWDDLD